MRMMARYALFRATGEQAHLEEARRLLGFAREHTAEEHRDAMIENVPLNREIMAAWRMQRR